MKTATILFALLLYTSTCFGGGDAVSVKIDRITEAGEKTVITFVLSKSEKRDLIQGCKVIEVTVEYSLVRRASWLPFLDKGHPTKDETDKAIKYLKDAHRKNEEVLFGYMGTGLVPTVTTCSFKSKGLRIEQDRGMTFVLSFHNRT